jgi:hypothetical protein
VRPVLPQGNSLGLPQGNSSGAGTPRSQWLGAGESRPPTTIAPSATCLRSRIEVGVTSDRVLLLGGSVPRLSRSGPLASHSNAIAATAARLRIPGPLARLPSGAAEPVSQSAPDGLDRLIRNSAAANAKLAGLPDGILAEAFIRVDAV